ncbi:MAG: hypothetical protein JSS07_10675 [Proteobacteria bacterium]|nr:hypothetical protein [Pseudomonadota bacterium]
MISNAPTQNSKNVLQTFAGLPLDMVNIMLENLPIPKWTTLSYTSKEVNQCIKKRSQELLEIHFPFVKNTQAKAFEVNPLKLLTQKFVFLEQKYKIPLSLILSTFDTEIEEISQHPDAQHLLALKLQRSEQLPVNLKDAVKITESALIDAAALCNLDLVKKLMPQCNNKACLYAAVAAATYGHIDIIKALYKKIDRDNISELLLQAIKYQQHELVLYLVKNGVGSNAAALSQAIIHGDKNYDTVAYLLKNSMLDSWDIDSLLQQAYTTKKSPRIITLLRKKRSYNSPYNDSLGSPFLDKLMRFFVSLAIGLGITLKVVIPFFNWMLPLSFTHTAALFGVTGVITAISYLLINQLLVAFWGNNSFKLSIKGNSGFQAKEPRKHAALIKFSLSLAASLGLSFIVFASTSLALSTVLLASAFTLFSTLLCIRLIPIDTLKQEIEHLSEPKDWKIEKTEETCSLLSMMDLYYPYKTRVSELETDIYEKLTKLLDAEFKKNTPEEQAILKQAMEANSQTFFPDQKRYQDDLKALGPLTRLFTYKLVCAHEVDFYVRDRNDISYGAYTNIDETDPKLQKHMKLLKLK